MTSVSSNSISVGPLQLKWLKDVLDDTNTVKQFKKMLSTYWHEEFNEQMPIAEYPQRSIIAFAPDGKVCATIGAGIDDPDMPPDWIWLVNLVVLEEYRGRGYADILLNFMINQINVVENRDLYIICEDRLVPMYEGYGFKFMMNKYQTIFKRNFNVMVMKAGQFRQKPKSKL